MQYHDELADTTPSGVFERTMSADAIHLSAILAKLEGLESRLDAVESEVGRRRHGCVAQLASQISSHVATCVAGCALSCLTCLHELYLSVAGRCHTPRPASDLI